VQTPQAFAPETLRRALEGGGIATDCAGLVEAAGGRVKVVRGDPRLAKITTADDLDHVETMLSTPKT
jgi:2-C-methyl-D-erythritol 4-phosphate cytidylyltransferase